MEGLIWFGVLFVIANVGGLYFYIQDKKEARKTIQSESREDDLRRGREKPSDAEI